jgi:hypothetical protein
MSLLDRKTDHSQRGSYDELYTPREAIEDIAPFLPGPPRHVWEPTHIQGNNITRVLSEEGYIVTGTSLSEGKDFMECRKDADLIVTNPPYSKKDAFLQRAFELNTPFAFLLPTTTLGAKKRNDMFRDKNIEVVIPGKRYNFKPEKGGAWFHTSWFTWKLGIGQQLTFL